MTTVAYALVSQDGNVIADYTAPITTGSANSQFYVNIDAVARTHLPKLPSENGTGSTCILGHYFHHSIVDGVVMLCVTTSNENPDLPRQFLSELRSSCTTHVLKNKSARSEWLSRILSNLVIEYNATSDKLRSIESALQQTADSLRSNIASILERGEVIDSLVSKSSTLKDDTYAFRTAAHRANQGFLRRIVQWLTDTASSRFSIAVTLVATALVLLYYIFVV